MNGIIDFAISFQTHLDLGAPIIMLIVLQTLLALLFGEILQAKVVLNLPIALTVSVPSWYVDRCFLLPRQDSLRTLVFNWISFGWAPLATIAVCLDTLLLVDYVDRQRYHAYDQENYTWRRYLLISGTLLSLVFWSNGMLFSSIVSQGVSLFRCTAARLSL